MELFKSFLFFLYFLIQQISYIVTEEITIFSSKNQISFAKILDYEISLSGKKEEITKYTYIRSFVSVVVNVTLSKECLANTNVYIKI